MSEQPTVADYIVRRLAREGITDCFGVAGDFAFKLCDAVARSEAIRWIGCSNELGAAYAAQRVVRELDPAAGSASGAYGRRDR
jgi:indolepyruvate decarboxylase